MHHARNSNHPAPSTNGGQLDNVSRVNSRAAAGSRKRVMIASSQLTYMGLLLAVFANQACLPVPSMAFLMVAGALARRGEMRRNHRRFFGCFRLPGSRWDLVLDRPPVGFQSSTAALWIDCRPPEIFPGCSGKVSPLWSPFIACVQVCSRDGWHHAPACRRSRSVIHPVPGLRCSRRLPLVGLLRGGGLSVRQSNGCGDWMGPAVWDRVRDRDWRFHRPLSGLAWTGLSTNDPSTTAAPYQPADARTQAQIRY